MMEQSKGPDVLASSLQIPYEFVYLNHHGTATTQQFGQWTLTSEDIRQIHPNPLFYFIWSCSNGDFTSLDYIAGSYLFDGEGLTVFAPTVPVLGNIESGIPFLFPLSQGATFGEAYRYASFFSPVALLGDPTLRLRQQPVSVPVLQLQQAEIDFGRVPVPSSRGGIMPLGASAEDAEITARNAGQVPLVFSPVPSFIHFLHDGQWPNATNSPLTFTLPDRIAPGQNAKLFFSFNPSQAGDYTGLVGIYTNDPHNTLFVVSFRGTASSTDVPGESSPVTANPTNACTGEGGTLAWNGPDASKPGQPVDLSLVASPSVDFKSANIRLVLPDGVELMDGETEWTGLLLASDAFEYKIVILVSRPGDYVITGLFEGFTADEILVSDCKSLTLAIQE
jgi:hypothetical protein